MSIKSHDNWKATNERGKVAGEVVHRVRKGQASYGKIATYKDKKEADSLLTDQKEILAKKPDGRLKWALKAMPLVAKGVFKITAFYDILAHPKFFVGFSPGFGRQARSLVNANMELFSAKQQKFLKSDACKLSSFEAAPEGVPDEGGGSEVDDDPAVLNEDANPDELAAAAGNEASELSKSEGAVAGIVATDTIPKSTFKTFTPVISMPSRRQRPQFNALDAAAESVAAEPGKEKATDPVDAKVSKDLVAGVAPAQTEAVTSGAGAGAEPVVPEAATPTSPKDQQADTPDSAQVQKRSQDPKEKRAASKSSAKERNGDRKEKDLKEKDQKEKDHKEKNRKERAASPEKRRRRDSHSREPSRKKRRSRSKSKARKKKSRSRSRSRRQDAKKKAKSNRSRSRSKRSRSRSNKAPQKAKPSRDFIKQMVERMVAP